MRTILFPREIGSFQTSDTLLTQNSPVIGEIPVSKWPVKIKFRNKVFAKIHRPCEGRNSYRVAWKAADGRQMKSFKAYSGVQGAKKFADELVKDLSNQNSVALLTSLQADDALSSIRCPQRTTARFTRKSAPPCSSMFTKVILNGIRACMQLRCNRALV